MAGLFCSPIELNNEDDVAQKSTLGSTSWKKFGRRSGTFVAEGHAPITKVWYHNAQEPAWYMHVEKVLNNMGVRDPVECFAHIHQCQESSMWLELVKVVVDEVD